MEVIMRPHRTIRAALAFLLSAPGVALAQQPVPPAAPSLAVLAPVAPRFESVRYWRREREPERVEARPKSPIQIHAGFFDPDGNSSNSFAFGLRGGPLVDDHIQIGLGLDWYHEAQNEREVVSRTSQNGVPVAVTRELSRASSDLVPLQAFLQVNLGDGRSLIPYAGIAGGYQVLFLSATDFQTGADYNATFGGWGWQAWGGAALPLSSRARMFGEAFYNWAEVGRDVDDPAAGVTYRELVDANGVGMRFGLSWGF
jgi:hypothetical protein